MLLKIADVSLVAGWAKQLMKINMVVVLEQAGEGGLDLLEKADLIVVIRKCRLPDVLFHLVPIPDGYPKKGFGLLHAGEGMVWDFFDVSMKAIE